MNLNISVSQAAEIARGIFVGEDAKVHEFELAMTEAVGPSKETAISPAPVSEVVTLRSESDTPAKAELSTNTKAGEWSMVRKDCWMRSDNAVVLFDHGAVGVTSKPWLKRPRGWKAFGPGESSYNFLHYFRWRRNCSPIKVARKWRTAQAAMEAVDFEFPHGKTPVEKPAVVATPALQFAIPA